MKIHVLIIYVASILRHSTKWNFSNGKLFDIKWTVASCIYCPSRFSIPLYFLKSVNFLVLHASIAISCQLINCCICLREKISFLFMKFQTTKRLIMISLLELI